MKTIYRYTLAPYQGPHSRHTCPRCQKQRQFVRYIDTQQGTHLGDHVGRCNREINCGYHYTPKQYFAEKKGLYSEPLPRRAPPNPPPKPNTNRIEHRLFCRTLQQYEQNTFANYLTKLLSPKKAQTLIEQFYIGTAKHWPGATIFWQIDLLGEVRTGKIMRYGEDGKRMRKPFNHIQWVHRQLPAPQFQLQQCLFGLHQLRKAPADKTIALVESEKTAVIATAHFPALLWLATGSVHHGRLEAVARKGTCLEKSRGKTCDRLGLARKTSLGDRKNTRAGPG